jgi:general stress protein 26
MTDLDRALNDPEGLLWAELEAVHAGMLGIDGSGQHMQPMAHHVDRKENRLWFLTTRDTDLAQAMTSGDTSHFVIVSKAQDFHACISGRLEENQDRTILDALWNPTMANLFAKDKDDPSLMILSLHVKDAAIWASAQGTSHFTWGEPDPERDRSEVLGVRNHVSFA